MKMHSLETPEVEASFAELKHLVKHQFLLYQISHYKLPWRVNATNSGIDQFGNGKGVRWHILAEPWHRTPTLSDIYKGVNWASEGDQTLAPHFGNRPS